MKSDDIVSIQIQYFPWKQYFKDGNDYRNAVSNLFNAIVSGHPNTFVCQLATGIMACGRSSQKQRDIIIKFAKGHMRPLYDEIVKMGEYQR